MNNDALALTDQASITRQGFGTSESIVQHETASSAVAARVTAEIQARTIVALQRPRNTEAVRQRLLVECKRPAFAHAARYRVPRGQDKDGKQKYIEGLSIRFAEAAQRWMGNLDTASSIVYDDARKLILHVTCTDLESNTTYSSELLVPKTVERKWLKKDQQILGQRVNSYGEPVYIVEATEAEVTQQAAAMKSKEIRTLILRHLPGDLKDEAERVCIETARNEDAKDPDAARRILFDAFFSIGVPVEQLTSYLGHDGKVLSPSEIAELRAIYAAVRDGETSWIEVLDHKTGSGADGDSAKAQASKVQSVLDRAKAKQAAAAVKKAPPKHDPETGEIAPNPDDDGR